MSQGSQGSQVLDPKRLRRWLREMESRVAKLPSLKEAMKLNADDLKKFSAESTVSTSFLFIFIVEISVDDCSFSKYQLHTNCRHESMLHKFNGGKKRNFTFLSINCGEFKAFL
jgi:hypothetical protein